MKKKYVLLVEDDAAVRNTLKEIIEQEYAVIEASGYSEAIKQLRSHVDLAIVDYVLPDMDGFEVIKAIKKARPALPVIIMTGFSTEGAVIRALRAGVTDYIKKPINIPYLMKRLSEIFEGKKQDACSEGVGNREKFIMDGIIMHIEEHYMKDLSLDELSGMVCMGKSKFRKAFKESTGQGFRSYLNRVRAKNAAELLKNSNLAVSEITYYVGFDNATSFYRIFREIYGVSPKEFRGNQ